MALAVGTVSAPPEEVLLFPEELLLLPDELLDEPLLDDPLLPEELLLDALAPEELVLLDFVLAVPGLTGATLEEAALVGELASLQAARAETASAIRQRRDRLFETTRVPGRSGD